MQRGIQMMWTVGPLSAHTAAAFRGARHFETLADLLKVVQQAPDCKAVVVKGSRFMKMEQFVAALVASGTQGERRRAD